MGFKLIPAEFVVSGKLLGSYTLAGTLMQSPNYVPGVSGWAIFGDGSAEFNNGTFRGLIEAAAIVLQGTQGQVLVYSGPPAVGNLISSISGAPGTDSKGNPYAAGAVAYVSVTGSFAGTYAIVLADQLQPWGAQVAALSFNNQTSKATQAPAVTGQAHATAGTNLNLQSGRSTAGATGAAVQVQDSVSSGQTGGLVDVQAGKMQVLSQVDNNIYRVERLIVEVSPRSQSFSAVAPANIGGLSVLVEAGVKYVVRGRFIIEWNATSGTPEMQFAGPAISQYDVSFRTRQSGSSSTANTNALVSAGTANGTGYNDAASLVSVTGAMSAAGVFFDLDVWGKFTFSANGTLTLQAAVDTATKAWIVTSGLMELQPQ